MKPYVLVTILIFIMTLNSMASPQWPSGLITGGEQGVYNPEISEELRVRDGLPNTFRKLESGEAVRIAYLGGSITHAEGWRVKTFDWFKAQYPKADLIQIPAAVPGTGADFAACRLSKDLLPENPDLIFIEFRVNLGGGFEARAIEGVVRQIWEANPDADICFVYTIAEWFINDLQNGRQYFFGTIMETLANEYGIPSIDLGVEVIKQMNADTLVLKSPEPVEGKLHFSKDGVHPVDAGHELYRDIVVRSLLTMKDYGSPSSHTLPAPLVSDHFANASLIPSAKFRTSENWETVDTKNDAIYIRDRFRSSQMLQGAIKTSKVGETLEFDWDGQLICFTHIPQGHGMEIELSTDGATPKTYKLNQDSDHSLFAQFLYAPEQPQGKHTTRLTVTRLPEGQTFYCGQILLIGQPAR